jgi:flagellin
MGNVINTNVKALMASNALNKNGRVQQNVMESLSTGKSINRASDNAAGLSIRETMTSQINGLGAAIKNANDAVSQLQTTDGALNEVSSMFQRMRELAVLSVNDTYSSTQKTAMSTEFNQLSAEITRISEQTQWNGMSVLTGSGGNPGVTAGASVYTFQVGANTAQTLTVTIPVMSIGQFSVTGDSIATAAGATSAVADLDGSLSELNGYRSTIGGTINRLTHAIDNLTNVQQNATDSRSKVEDTDYAAATSELARTQIIAQAATAILAQANQQPQSVLSLLK